MRAVGAYLRACRKAASLTQEGVAPRVGVSSRTISDWEAGRYVPSFELMARYVRAVGGRIEEAARLLLDEPLDAPAMGVAAPLLNALAGLPVDKHDDPEGRFAELAHQITISPWLAERLQDISTLSQEEFQELMEYLEFRRRQRAAGRSSP